MKMTLCDNKSGQVSVYVEASVVSGKLLVSGQDIGPIVEKFFHDIDYEYFYSFNESNARKFLESLKPGVEIGELLALLAFKLSGLDGCLLLREHF